MCALDLLPRPSRTGTGHSVVFPGLTCVGLGLVHHLLQVSERSHHVSSQGSGPG